MTELADRIDELEADLKVHHSYIVGYRRAVTELEADLLTAGEIIIELTNASEAFNEAIQFALETDEPKTFLSYWNVGEWDVLRRDWPEFTIHKSLNEEIK
jgi:hypothetical protein